jgi:hypothetical protein
MAKSAAKNINSLESQTIVPTATIFGRFSREVGVAMALDMSRIIPENPALYPYRSFRRGGEAHHLHP